jgi:hypothetical protein
MAAGRNGSSFTAISKFTAFHKDRNRQPGLAM